MDHTLFIRKALKRIILQPWCLRGFVANLLLKKEEDICQEEDEREEGV